MDVSIVIVTHNSLAPVVDCLSSLRDHPPSVPHEIIVIDNASTDGTCEAVAERFDTVRLVANEENVGYSRGVNQGIRLSTGRMILVLNPDIIVNEASVDRLLAFMDRTPYAGIAGAKLVYPDGRLQYSCRSFYTMQALLLRRTFLGKLFPRARALREHLLIDYDHVTPRRVDWVLGACMMVRREAVERVGRMDERFFLYFEDIDWCYRMKQQGWNVYYVPDSVMIHRYERSSAKSILRKPFIIHMLSLLRYYEKWNKIFYFLRRHRGALKALVFVVSDLAAINLSFFAAYYLRDLLQPLFVNKLYPLEWYYFFILFYNLISVLTFLFSGLYRIRRETVWVDEFFRVVRSIFLVLVILTAATYLTRIRIYSRMVLLGQAVIGIFAVAGFRRFIRSIHRELVRARFDLKRVLLLGARDEVERLTAELAASPNLGIDVVGHVNDGPGSLGTIRGLPEIVERFKVQEVIILPSYQGEGAVLPFLMHSRGRMIQVRIVSPLARLLGRGARVEELGGLHVFSIERGGLFLFWSGLKRMIDFTAALMLLPVSAFFSAFHRAYGTITGRVRFFGEVRQWNGKSIHWPRGVRAGGGEVSDFSKCRLFVLVLGGRLSFIGPPPSLPSWPTGEIAGENSMFRAGITGAWRVSPSANWKTAMENEMLEMQNWSFNREIVILVQSIPALLTGTYPDWFYNDRRNS
ncbi:MAG TPA: glycosyltransferase [Patescibacteria group bacterium]|nr:glycosyltransferase [Patescibacteria group bacterium]